MFSNTAIIYNKIHLKLKQNERIYKKKTGRKNKNATSEFFFFVIRYSSKKLTFQQNYIVLKLTFLGERKKIKIKYE